MKIKDSNKPINDVTILVNTCDLYSDVWPLFFAALDEYWPNREYALVLNTERNNLEKMDGVTTHNFNAVRDKNTWGSRLLNTLDSIQTKYVISLYDDFILESNIDKNKIQEVINIMDRDEDIAAIYLSYVNLKTSGLRSVDPYGYSLVEDGIDFRLNSAPAVWRREDLRRYTGPHDNPWAWEVFGSYRTYGDGKAIYCPGSPEYGIYDYNSKKGGAIYRGKWVREVVIDKNDKYNLNIDFSKRGFSVDGGYEKRSLKWKIDFLLLGYKMVGFKVLKFVYRSFKIKFL